MFATRKKTIGFVPLALGTVLLFVQLSGATLRLDVDGDGLPEKVALSSSADPSARLSYGGQADEIRQAVATDLDFDGRLDVIVSAGERIIHLQRADPDAPWQNHEVASGISGDVEVFDVDGDGLMEIVVGDRQFRAVNQGEKLMWVSEPRTERASDRAVVWISDPAWSGPVVGTSITFWSDGDSRQQWLRSGPNVAFAHQGGLDSVSVIWPDGIPTTSFPSFYADSLVVQRDRSYVLSEQDESLVTLAGDGKVEWGLLDQIEPPSAITVRLVHFAPVSVGTIWEGKSVEVWAKNPGDQPLLVDHAEIAGLDAQITETTVDGELADSASWTVVVEGDGFVGDSVSAELLLFSAEWLDEPVRVPLSGIWGEKPPTAEIEYSYGDVQTDSTAVWRTVLPRWLIPVEWANVPEPVDITTEDLDGDSTAVTVRLTPLAVGDLDLTLNLFSGRLRLFATGVDTIPPQKPSALITGFGADEVSIGWRSAVDADVDVFEVVCWSDQHFEILRTALPETVFVDRGMSEGEGRTYVVSAVDVAGNMSQGDTLHVARPDTTSPVVFWQLPFDERRIGVAGPIKLRVFDSGVGVALDSVSLVVGGLTVPENQLLLAFGDSGLTVSHTPQILWPLDTALSVMVSAVDIAGNRALFYRLIYTVHDTVFPSITTWEASPLNIDDDVEWRGLPVVPRGLTLSKVSMHVRHWDQMGYLVDKSLEAAPSGSLWTVSLPGSWITGKGLSTAWEMTLSDSVGGEEVWNMRWDTPGVRIEEAFWPGSADSGSGFAFISVPYVSAELVTDDDALDIRSFDTALQMWSPIESPADLLSGDAAWVRWTGDNAPIVQISDGITRARTDTTALTLAPGWNLVGLPYGGPVSWQEVVAANQELVIHGPWGMGQYLALADSLKPWAGYWVANPTDEPVRLFLPPTTGERLTSTEPDGDEAELPGPLEWTARVSVSGSQNRGSELSCGWREIGLEADRVVAMMAPPAADSVVSAAWVDLDADGGLSRLGMDFREVPIAGVESVWHIGINSQKTQTIELVVDLVNSLPPDVSLLLIDLLGADTVDVTRGGGYRFVAEEPFVELLLIAVNTHSSEAPSQPVAASPKSLALQQNEPNPFNASTTIRFVVPQTENGPSVVRVAVYNMLGQHIRTLFDQIATPGVYEVRWNGRDEAGQMVSSGLYFYDLNTRRERIMKRMAFVW